MNLTLTEAAKRIGKSERTVRRLISAGKIKAQKNDVGEWVITDLGEMPAEPPPESEHYADMIQMLKSEVEYLREENQELREQLSETRQRSDTIILQLTTQHNKMLEDRRPFWRRLRGKKGEKEPEM